MIYKTLPYIVQIISSLFEIIGAYMLYKYANPPHVIRLSGAFIGTGENTAKEIETNKKYDKRLKQGIKLIIIGFIIQFCYAAYCITTICLSASCPQ